ncbi:MAG: TolC family protein [Caulobacteraceae bacterium]
MKKLCFVLSIMLCMAVLFPSLTAQADSTGVVKITLEEAQARALENSLDYQQQDGVISDALDSYYNTQDSNEKQASSASKSFIDYFNKPVTLEINLETAANKVKATRLQKENLKRTSDYNVMKAFVNIKKAQNALDTAKNNTAAKYSEYETAKAKYSFGLITASALKQAENTYKSAQDSETTAQKNLQQQIQTLNRYLGRELTDYNIEPVIEFSIIDLSKIDLDKVREDNIKNKESLYNLELNAETAKRKYDLTKEQYDKFVVKYNVQNSRDDMEEAYDDATSEYDQARKAFEDATIDLDMQLNTAYDSLKSAVENINELNEDLVLAKSDAEKASIQYDMGLISKDKLNEAESKLKDLDIQIKNSTADLNLKYAELMMYSDTSQASTTN